MSKDSAPTPEEVQELYDENKSDFDGLYAAFQSDDKYYELDFRFELDLPKEQKDKGVVLPTARSNVDSFGYYIDIANARVSVSRHGTSKAEKEAAESLRKFGAGLIFMTNVEGMISPWRIAAKHYPKYGVAWLKTVYDADLWPDKPSDESKIEEWLDACKGQLPIVIQAVNPQCIMFDTGTMGKTWVMEIHTKKVKDILRRYPDWNPKKRDKYKPNDEVKHICWWSNQYRCDLIGGEAILKTKSGVANHKYGFVPFVGIDAGLGDVTADGDLSKRFVGINRYLHDLLRSESRDYSITDIIAAKNAWPWGYIEGGESVGTLDTSFGTYTGLPVGAKVIDMVPKMAPRELTEHFLTTRNLITESTISPALKGQSQEGVRSGADRRQIMSAGQYFLRPAGEAFKYRSAQVLNNCARLLQILPGDVRVYSHTPADEFEDIIDKTKIKEPINFHVEFGPTSEEDDYRKHDDDIRSVHEGIMTKDTARKRRSDLNAKDEERNELKQRIKDSPAFQMFIDQTLGTALQAAFAKRQAAEGLPASPPTGAPPPGGPAPSGQPQGGMIAPVRQVPPLGSAAAQQAKLKQQRSQIPTTATQGQFGGGARGAQR